MQRLRGSSDSLHNGVLATHMGVWIELLVPGLAVVCIQELNQHLRVTVCQINKCTYSYTYIHTHTYTYEKVAVLLFFIKGEIRASYQNIKEQQCSPVLSFWKI